MSINNRDKWLFENPNIFDSRDAILKHNIISMLNRTTEMFEYENLPETIPRKDLEIQLQVQGYTIWKEVNGKLYTFIGGLGGQPNVYYLPTIATVANPALNYSEALKIDDNCVVMLNDYFYEGLMPLFSKYANLLTDADMSLRYALINTRIPALVQADDDNSQKTAEEFFKKIQTGEGYGIMCGSEFLDSIKTHDFYRTSHIKEIIEATQYIKGSWYNELGINAAFNMKREAINEAEANLNEDMLYPFVDAMLECRKIGLKKVNKMFGTNIKVKLNSVWARTREEDRLAIEKEKAEIKSEGGDINESV